MKYEVAIPSYRRPQTVVEKTLTELRRLEVPKDCIRIFVADDAEAEEYDRSVPRDWYKELVVGVKGMAAIRNFIQTWYPEGTPLLYVDDDIRSVLFYRSKKATEPGTPEEFERMVVGGFRQTRSLGFKLWGIMAGKNPFWMSETPSTNLKFICGDLYGIWVTHDLEKYGVNVDDKEDYERSIKYFLADGGVFRWNHVACETAFYLEPGGMQEDRTLETIRQGAEYIVSKYPGLARMNPHRKGPRAEIRLVPPRKRR